LHFIFLLHDAYIIYTQADIDTATHPAHTFNVCCRNRFRPPIHPFYDEQHTVNVCLEKSGELVSAFLNGWLQEGMRRKQAAVGDLILIQFLERQAGERFNRFQLEIQKDQPEMF
jgi:hypothetical protein